jgi:predicted O-linked N-acetylglucosamine transferase (SPINDLY family)
VEVFCYASIERPDAVTSRIRQHVDHWREIFPLDDAQAAALVRDDQIDILVDLAGHTADHRLLVFARRPAPVQVTYLGYCDTTGLEAMDYLLTDRQIDPVGADTRLVSEQLVRLPDAWTCYRPPDDAPDVGPLPALRHGHVTFASFHTLAKLNETLLEWWAQILIRVPDSRLLIAAFGLRDDGARGQLRDFFAARGVSAERLEFRGWQTQRGYLEMHSEVDILLDSHPFSGHTVSCHALWMGVPPVTLMGARPCGRLVASVLHNAGLPELIAQSPDEYMRIAADLATDLPRLAALRTALREQTAASPLMDAPRFARAVEDAYRQMWQAWCALAQGSRISG